VVWSGLIAAALALTWPAQAAAGDADALPQNCVEVADAIICVPPERGAPPIFCFVLDEPVVDPDGKGIPAGFVFCGFGVVVIGEAA